MEITTDLNQVWIDQLSQSIGRKTARRGAIKYVTDLIDQKLPPIFDFQHLSLLLGINDKALASVIFSTPNFYRSFSIPKRSGGMRQISVPYPMLLESQRWILKNIIESIPTEAPAHGFVKGRSIVTFAKQHAGQTAMLHVDIANFFPSITFRQIYSIFASVGYAPNVAYYLARVCCLDDSLPQGAVTSPHLSNLVARNLDRRLSALAVSLNLEYSRYADNMVFSGDGIPLVLLDLVASILIEEGFKINIEKSYLSTGRGKRVVVGVSIANEELKLPRATKRRLRQEAFHLITKGFDKHTRKIGVYDPIYVERLVGKLGFWVFIEPTSQSALRLLNQVKELRSKLPHM